MSNLEFDSYKIIFVIFLLFLTAQVIFHTSGFGARPVVQCSAVVYEQATELSQQLLLLQSDTRHHALQPAAVQASADK